MKDFKEKAEIYKDNIFKINCNLKLNVKSSDGVETTDFIIHSIQLIYKEVAKEMFVKMFFFKDITQQPKKLLFKYSDSFDWKLETDSENELLNITGLNVTNDENTKTKNKLDKFLSYVIYETLMKIRVGMPDWLQLGNIQKSDSFFDFVQFATTTYFEDQHSNEEFYIKDHKRIKDESRKKIETVLRNIDLPSHNDLDYHSIDLKGTFRIAFKTPQ